MRVLIADDHDLLREFFDAWLRKEGIEVTAACDLHAALAIARNAPRFDLVLLDFRMPGMDRLEGLELFLSEAKGAPVALMSGNAGRDVVEDALRIGAVGFLFKAMPPTDFVGAVRRMAEGERVLPREIGDAPQAKRVSAGPSEVLSRRERDVLEKLCEGKSDTEIARALGLGAPTVRLLLKTLCRKLGVEGPSQAAELACKDRLV